MAFNGNRFNGSAFNGADVAPPFNETGVGQLVAIEQQIVLTPPIQRSGFAFNERKFNQTPFNAWASVPIYGEGLIVSFEQETVAVGSGQMVAFEQAVGIYGSGEMVSIEQDVRFFETGSGQLVSIEQSTKNGGSGQLVRFEQSVRAAAATHLERTGWDAKIMLGGAEVPRDQIFGMIDIKRNEGGASLATFTILPPRGIQQVESYAGKTVTIDFETVEGIFRVYTGLVDIPELDLINRRITLNCTDRRSELINAQLASVVQTIGYYSFDIFGTPKDTFEDLTNRLTTVPYTVDFDAYGNYNVVALRGKTTPDYVLTGNKVYYREPRVEYTSRGRVVNKITISFKYRYERLWHMQRNWTWESPVANNICLVLQQGYSFTQRSMIKAAVDALAWPLRGDITYTPIQPAGWYCGGIGFTTVSYSPTGGITTPALDSNGDPILDSSGNPVTTTSGVYTDVRNVLCNGASWTATKRWAQTVSEEYTFVVAASQSQAQYGTVEQFNSYASEDDSGAGAWEDYKAYDNPYNKVDPTYYVNVDASRNAANSAIVTALSIAKTTILNSHRDTRVTIYRSIWPQIDLKHTVEINTGILKARGKVYTISHSLNNGTGEAVTNVVLALSRAEGSGADTSLSIPTRPTDVAMPDTTSITLGNHIGEDPDTEAAQLWNGRVGDKGFTPYDIVEQFIVDTPEIQQEFRQERVLTGSAGYNVSIPIDLLEVTF